MPLADGEGIRMIPLCRRYTRMHLPTRIGVFHSLISGAAPKNVKPALLVIVGFLFFTIGYSFGQTTILILRPEELFVHGSMHSTVVIE
jgi:hypothetical protein